jgi:hypothetical protein
VSSTEARRQAAARYISCSIAVIPVPDGEKKPGLPDWQDLRLTAEDVPRYWTNDLRIPGAAERLHRARALCQERSDIEALDEDHLILILRSSEGTRLAA